MSTSAGKNLMKNGLGVLALGLTVLGLSSTAQAGNCTQGGQPVGVETTPIYGIRVDRNGMTENHSNPLCRIKLDYIDQAAAIEIRRWGTTGRSQAQVVDKLRRAKVNLLTDEVQVHLGGGQYALSGYHTSFGQGATETFILVVGDADRNGLCFSGDASSKVLIHEWDHALGFLFAVPFASRIGPGHTPWPAPETWSGPGMNIDGSVMQPFSPVPAYENYCVDQTPAEVTHTTDNWGLPSDIPFTGKFFQTDKEDIAVFRESDSTFYVKKVGGEYRGVKFGQSGDIAVPADYNGTGHTEIAVFRPSNGTWYLQDFNTGAFTAIQWGMEGDVPVPGNFFGTGKADLAVFRPSNGAFYIKKVVDGEMKVINWGMSTDRPIAGDFLGKGRDQLAQYRSSSHVWYIMDPADGATANRRFGADGDIPLTGRVTSANSDDIIMFRPATGMYYITNMVNEAFESRHWGQANDVPLVGKLRDNGNENLVIFRAGQWWIKH
ncbi:MAG TPA: hypothetical protein VNJ01_11235 [Bacteriovoracaceae bacterium]|nr:hypothetical protein [Bacteriovoracaceae bacterium]